MTEQTDDANDPVVEDRSKQDTLHEECGVFGIFDHADAGALAVLGLHSAPASRPGSGGHRHL